jgi:CHAD domain-containing protein
MRTNSTRLLCKYLDTLVDDLRALLPQAFQRWDADAIHDARVTTRRLKAAVDACQEQLPPDSVRPFSKALRRLRRRLGPLRDLDVMLLHLEEPALRNRHEAAHDWLRQRLTEHRDQLRDECAGRASIADWLNRLASWWAVRDAIAGADVDWRMIASARLRQQSAEFCTRAAQLAAGSDRDAHGAVDAHGLRIAGKLLRYTLELAGKVGLDTPRALLRSFKAFQDALGSWHDFIVLSQRISAEASAPTLAYTAPSTYEQLLSTTRFAWARSSRDLTRFGRLWQRKGLSLSERIEAVAASAVPKEAAEPVSPPTTTEPPVHDQITNSEVHDEGLPGTTCGSGESAGDEGPAPQ